MCLKKYLPVLVIALLVITFSRCLDAPDRAASDKRGVAYAGAETCSGCHKTVHDAYAHTGHARTSRPLGRQGAGVPLPAGSFGFNAVSSVGIRQRDSGLFQVAYESGREVMARRFDLAFGSGEKASSFASWINGTPYQLPLSYFAVVPAWANSPGFPAHEARFERVITVRCFECHSSYIAAAAAPPESITGAQRFEEKSLIYGIDCERCHGPAAEHVAFHTTHPAEKAARFITPWKLLSRQQKLDACAVCHSGNDLTTQQSTFLFVPGDTLSRFYYPEFGPQPSSLSDVHGKQLQLLEASRCFLNSNTLECATCHNPHGPAQPDLAAYSAQCLGCHQQGSHTGCPKEERLGPVIRKNCIDCHMPQQVSRTISFQLAGKESVTPYLLRTHRIAVYADIPGTARK